MEAEEVEEWKGDSDIRNNMGDCRRQVYIEPKYHRDGS